MTPDLPVAAAWFQREEVEPGVTKLLEPHVDRLMQANLWHVRGRDRDLLIDGGMGVAPLRPAFPDLFDAGPVLAVATHTHLDHIGAMHEFPERWVHAIEADGLAAPRPASLFPDDLDPKLRQMFVDAGYAPFGPTLIDALPHAGYDLSSYRLQPAPATRLLREGDVVDLGDRAFEVPLLYEGGGMDVGDYVASFRRLRELPVRVVHAGHDPSFGPERMHAIVDDYLRRWGAG